MGKFGLSSGLLVVCGALGLFSDHALADRRIVDELRKLRDSLSVRDRSRPELTLRLADLLVDESFLGKDRGTRGLSDRREALALYHEVLSGGTVSSGLTTKIRFQMARLYLESGDFKQAQPLLTQIAAQNDMIDLKREAILRLAEQAEIPNPTLAQKYYRDALALCAGTDACSFGHYRISWIYRNEGKIREAIDEMTQALWDSKNQIREEALRDYVAFMGLDATRSADDLSAIEKLAAKLSRPTLLEDLANSYFASGSKAAAVQVLEVVNARAPTISSQIKLLEEYYGLRQWEKFERTLGDFVTALSNPQMVSAIQDPSALEKVCRRIAIQLDGERTTKPEHAKAFQDFSLAYLKLFPKGPEAFRIMEGWVAAEKSEDVKLAQIALWLGAEASLYSLSVTDQWKFHELRAAIAQKSSKNEVVVEEMQALLSSHAPEAQPKKREYRYVLARTFYAMKDFTKALPLFQELAALPVEPKAGFTPDDTAVKSQHLALDVLNANKDYAAIAAQAKLWTSNASVIKAASLSKDLAEMKEVADEAEFEAATKLGETLEGLKTFLAFCEAGRFTPKSCDNSKFLAVKLQRHPELIRVLKILNATEELASEYELTGHFAEAAKLRESLKPKVVQKEPTPIAERLKLAMLYELGSDPASRDGVLGGFTQPKSNYKPSEPEAMAILITLKDAGLVTAKTFDLPWGDAFRLNVAEYLEAKGQGTAGTRAALLASKTEQGPAWSKYVLEEASKLAASEAKISFYGRGSEQKFNSRVAAQKKLATFADLYLPGASLATRTALYKVLEASYTQLAKEISESPIPETLAADQIEQIKTGLAEMAKPFQERALAIASLAQAAQPVAAAASAPVSGNAASIAAGVQVAQAPRLDLASVRLATEALHQNPKDRAALTGLKQAYEAAGMVRLSRYFEGRLSEL